MIRTMKEPEMNIEQRTCQVWAVLAFAAHKGHILTYMELEQATGFIRVGLGDSLRRIQSYCRRKKLPNLSSLVVNKKNGMPDNKCLRDYEDEDWAKTQFFVYQHDWLGSGNPGVANFSEAK